MSDFATGVIATFITAPVLGLYIIYFILVKTTKKKQFSFKVAVDYTVLLFITSVYFLCLEIWELQIGWFVLLFLLMSASLFTILHWKYFDDIDLKRVFKSVWRFQFVVYCLLYFFLIIYGLIFQIYA